MEIELSAAKAWRAAALRDAAGDDVRLAACAQITDNIIGRLEADKSVTYDNTIASIARCDDPASEELLLEQVKGIAHEQGQNAVRFVDNQIKGLRCE